MDGAISVQMDRCGMDTSVCKFCYFGKAAQVEFADIAFQFSNSILLGAPATQMAMVQRCSCNVRPSGSEILTHQRMSTVIH